MCRQVNPELSSGPTKAAGDRIHTYSHGKHWTFLRHPQRACYENKPLARNRRVTSRPNPDFTLFPALSYTNLPHPGTLLCPTSIDLWPIFYNRHSPTPTAYLPFLKTSSIQASSTLTRRPCIRYTSRPTPEPPEPHLAALNET